MAVLEIKTAGNPVLRQVASKVTRIDKRIKRLLSDMADTMYKADGVGLAAPQIGVSVRIVVIDAGEGIVEMINPEIISKEGSCVNVEGCLSVPNFDGEVERAKSVRVKYQDRNGKPIVLDATELLAIAVQHEVDHLDGILFIDKANVENAPIVFAETIFADFSTQKINKGWRISTSEYPNLLNSLSGFAQEKNTKTVLAAVSELKKIGYQIPKEAVYDGFANVVQLTGLMGRWQVLQEHPKIVCDTGHNAHGIRYIVEQFQADKYDNLHIVFVLVNDNEYNSI